MIIITGAAGFIGSCMISYMKKKKYTNLIAIDHFGSEAKEKNYADKDGILKIDRKEAFSFIATNAKDISLIIHLGARTDTVDPDPEIFLELNVNYSKKIWELCVSYQIPLIYASSAATYGDGGFGFDDKMQDITKLIPLNEYGRSKQVFDEWVLQQEKVPPNWVGLKFFNVYGPNEYHKSRMASVIFHAFHQIKKTGKMKLFRSHVEEFEDGKQLRDFIYVKDVCKTIVNLYQDPADSGLYNLGTGKARTFIDLVKATFHAMELPPNIEFIDIPVDIRDNYQYFTEADMDKLESQIGSIDFYSLEDGVNDYVGNFLSTNQYF